MQPRRRAESAREALRLPVRRREHGVEQPGKERVQVVLAQTAHFGGAPVRLVDDPALAQDPEVVRGGGLGDRKLEGGAGQPVRGTRQLPDDAQPYRIGQRVQYAFDPDRSRSGTACGPRTERTAAGTLCAHRLYERFRSSTIAVVRYLSYKTRRRSAASAVPSHQVKRSLS